MKLLKKFWFSFLASLIVLFSFTAYLSPAKADTTWYNQSFQEWYGKVYNPRNPGEIFGERYTAAQVQWIIYGLESFLINTGVGTKNAGLVQCFISNVANVNACIGQLNALLAVNNPQNSTVATSGTPSKQNLLSLVFATDRPISGIAYVKNLLQKFSPVTTVRAESVGTGFNALQPVQAVWTIFRNISFGLFVIVAIVFAFMIMFRVKLSPQTVVSVQSALPKLVLYLILVTFSYAIAGFLIDLMYVAIGLVSMVGSQLTIGGGATAFGSAASTFNILTLGQPTSMPINIGALGLLIVYVVAFCIMFIILLLINIANMGAVLASVSMTLLFASGIVEIFLILGIIAGIILIIVAIIDLFKILWGLIKAFVNILLLTIFAPIQLTLGAVVPSLGFGAWVKSYVSNLAVFVVTGALILFSYYFLSEGASLGLSSLGVGGTLKLFVMNVVIGSALSGHSIAAWPPLLGGSGDAGVGLLLVIASFVIFTLIPKANEIIQGLMSGRPYAYGSAVGEAVKPVVGMVANPASTYYRNNKPTGPASQVASIISQQASDWSRSK